MANTISAVMPKIIARALLALRQRCTMARVVQGDFDAEARKKGSTIDIPVSSALTASDVTPGVTPSTPSNSAPTTVQLVLDTWKKVNFHLTDKELGEIDASTTFMPLQMSEAVKALANTINQSIFALYKDIYGYVAAAGGSGTAMASDADARNVRKILNQQLCPLEDRVFMLDFGAEANALGLAAFRDYSQSSDNDPIINGNIGRKFGFRFFSDDHVPTHTAGTITTGLIAKASTAQAAGLETIVAHTAASTGACALLAGDIIAIAGDSQTYVLTAAATQASANSDVNLSISPPLAQALVGSEAITVKATHVANLAFAPGCLGFAMRPLADLEVAGLGNQILTVQDPVSRLILRLEVSRQNKQTMWELDALWGVKTIRREFGCRLAG